MRDSSRGFGVQDHKTSFLQFNNPFNTIFQSHFMLSKARISGPFADIDFVEELLFRKQWWHDLIMGHHYQCALSPVQATASCDAGSFNSSDSCPKLKCFDRTCSLFTREACFKNLFTWSFLLSHVRILRRKYGFNCLNRNKGQGSPGLLKKLLGTAVWSLDFILKLSSAMRCAFLWRVNSQSS